MADPEEVWGPVVVGRAQGNFLPVADPAQDNGRAVAGQSQDNGRRVAASRSDLPMDGAD